MPVGGRGAGKFGYANTFHTNTGRSYHDINEEIIWVSIGMAVTIGILITIALCYILYEKCQKKREICINA
ncbi:unnamed protein product [Diamesa hyperborea]